MPAIKKKLTTKDFNPKRLLAQPETVRRMSLGTLFGIANDITIMTMPDGQVLEGLVGQFLFKDTDTDVKPTAAYILWMPSGMGGDLYGRTPAGDDKGEGPRAKQAIEFAYVVGVSKAENPAGYEWFFEPLIAPTENDPLAALAAKVEQALPAPETAPKIEAPAPEVPKAAEHAKAHKAA